MDGALYAVPWYVDTRLLYYRTDLLRAGRVRIAARRTGTSGLQMLARDQDSGRAGALLGAAAHQ